MPTGALASEELFTRIINLAHTHDFIIAHDNPYSFVLNEHPKSILSVPGAMEVCLELNSLSKTFNMSGWRIGWVAGNPELLSHVLKVKSNMDSGMFKPLQLAAVEALKTGDEWYAQLNKEYSRRREQGYRIFDRLSVAYSKNSSGMFLWGRVKDGTGVELADKLLYEKHIFIAPGIVFGEVAENYVRLSLCQPVEILKEALERL
jgi:hypothetical protein